MLQDINGTAYDELHWSASWNHKEFKTLPEIPKKRVRRSRKASQFPPFYWTNELMALMIKMKTSNLSNPINYNSINLYPKTISFLLIKLRPPC